MDVHVEESKRISNITLWHKLKKRITDRIAVLYFTITVGSSIMSITHTLRSVWNIH